MPEVTAGLVSIVLVNFRGTDDTIAAVATLEDLDWPRDRLEIIVVENGSGDDSLARLQALGSRIVLVPSAENLGFAGGCNLGVDQSSGEFVSFLNNDARPDRAWVRAAIDKFAESNRIAGVASKVLDWEGERVDFIGAALTWYGMGYKPFTAEKFESTMPRPTDVLFGTGSAMFVRRSVFLELGGFDERYFMFFEDVDFGWRLNLRGWRFAYCPASIAFHKHHGSMGGFGAFREQYLLERNALYTLYKNLEPETLAEALPAAMALAVRRSLSKAGVDSESLDIRRADEESANVTVPRDALTATFGIDQFVENLPALRASRDAIQQSRTVSDSRIWRLFGTTDAPAFQDPRYLDGYEKVVHAFDVIAPPVATSVLIITGDPIGRKLAGPAIRAWNMAELLSESASVTLVSLAGVEPVEAPFDIVHIRPRDDRSFAKLEKHADVIIFQGHAMDVFDSLRKTNKIVVVDIYDPMHLEQLEQARELPPDTWNRQVAGATDILNEQLVRGDFFLCASDRQKHFYLGQLAALGRINPATYTGDPDLDGLISIVPFGLNASPPTHDRNVLKGVKPGIGLTDKVLLWSGGLYNWFDPKTLIRAVADVSTRHAEVKLFFQGTKHPNPDVPEMAIVAESRQLAQDLGVLDSSVFFNDSWVDNADRGSYLSEADVGVSTHHSHVETTYSFRTRILDYLWAELPMVVTAGDHFAELVERENLGVVVPAGDVEALAAAIEKVVFDDRFRRAARRNIKRVRERYYWRTVLEPLVQFVNDPHRARDYEASQSSIARMVRPRKISRRRSGVVRDASLAIHYLRNGGARVVISKVARRLRRR